VQDGQGDILIEAIVLVLMVTWFFIFVMSGKISALEWKVKQLEREKKDESQRNT
jgi:antibiotic biosynthesis monooxygenase (ABM) superfamily enzyme